MINKIIIRITALITIITLFLSLICPPINAYAWYDKDTGTYYFKNYEDVANLAKWVLSLDGFILTGDWEGLEQNADFINWCNNTLANENQEYFRTENGQLAVTNKAVNELTSAARKAVSADKSGTAAGDVTGDYGDYYIVPTLSYSEFWAFYDGYSFKHPLYHSELRSQVLSKFNSSDKWFVRLQSDEVSLVNYVRYSDLNIYAWLYEDQSDYDFIDGVFFDKNGNSVYSPFNGGYFYVSNDNKCKFSSRVYDNFMFSLLSFKNSPKRLLSDWNLISKTGENIKVWKSRQNYLQYVNGASSGTNKYYTSNNFYNYDDSIDNSITINKQTVQYITEGDFISDYGDAYTTIVNNVKNEYQTNSGITESQIHTIVTAVLDELTTQKESPPEPESPSESESESKEPGSSEGPSGSVSGNSPGADGPQTLSWLEKIYNKLVDILAYLEGGIIDALKAIKNAITANTVVDVLGGVIGLLKDLISAGGDAAGGFVDNVGEAFSGAVELLPEKFPFCIPWDLIAVFTVLAATPAPPVFDIPFSVPSLGINETFTIDLSAFDTVAVLCRSLLSLLFILYLINMTVKLVNSSGGDD